MAPVGDTRPKSAPTPTTPPCCKSARCTASNLSTSPITVPQEESRDDQQKRARVGIAEAQPKSHCAGAPLKSAVIIVAAVTLGAAGTAWSRTLQIDQLVELNTGATVQVSWTVEYALRGAPGNPFDISMTPANVETLRFTWDGKEYRYEGDANLMLLAIGPDNRPVLVARAADKGWNWRHRYACTLPAYVQFVPDATGTHWTWPPQISSWLFKLPGNLLLKRGPLDEMKRRYTPQERAEADAVVLMQTPSYRQIEPEYRVASCPQGGASR